MLNGVKATGNTGAIFTTNSVAKDVDAYLPVEITYVAATDSFTLKAGSGYTHHTLASGTPTAFTVSDFATDATLVTPMTGSSAVSLTYEQVYSMIDASNFTAAKAAPGTGIRIGVPVVGAVKQVAPTTVVKSGVTVQANLPKVEGKDLSEGTVVGGVVEQPGQTIVNTVAHGHYTGNIDKNWSINLIEKSTGVAELIEKAELYKATAADVTSYGKYSNEVVANGVYLKITLEDEWKTTTSETLKYYVYIADNKAKDHKTNEVWVSGKYENTDYEWVNFDWTNDASRSKLWKVHDDENGIAVFDFADKAFFSVKMYGGETMYLDLKTAYDKAIAGEMDAEADSYTGAEDFVGLAVSLAVVSVAAAGALALKK